MSIRRATFTATAILRKQVFSNNVQHMSSRSGTGRRTTKSASSSKKTGIAKAPPAATDPWVEVLDSKSGQVYFWNQKTDETTALGAPKPTLQNNAVAQQAPPQESMASGLGAVVAQGFAFGVGSSIARSVVGSMMGGSSDTSGGGDSGGGDSGGAEFDM